MAITWSARTVAAIIMGIVILTVSLYNVGQAFSDADEKAEEVDVRRMAQMIEVLDHRPGTVIEMSFPEEYSYIALEEDRIVLGEEDDELGHDILTANDIEPGEISDTRVVCFANDGSSLTLTEDCELPDMDPDDEPEEPVL